MNVLKCLCFLLVLEVCFCDGCSYCVFLFVLEVCVCESPKVFCCCVCLSWCVFVNVLSSLFRRCVCEHVLKCVFVSACLGGVFCECPQCLCGFACLGGVFLWMPFVFFSWCLSRSWVVVNEFNCFVFVFASLGGVFL